MHCGTSIVDCSKQWQRKAYFNRPRAETLPWFLKFRWYDFCSFGKIQKGQARKVLQDLYDGTPKVYPRGEMLLFISIKSRLEEDYTLSQRDKFLFNHNKYLGTEDCMAIFGFKDINTMITLKTGVKVTLHTLLKSIPGALGMSKSRLFQVVDPNSSHLCTLITFPAMWPNLYWTTARKTHYHHWNYNRPWKDDKHPSRSW